MNIWTVVVYLLFSIILTALVLAVISYVKHWAKRKASMSVSTARTQGYYFKRYVPQSLYQKYDSANYPVGEKTITRIRFIERTLIICAIVIGSLLIIFPLYTHTGKYLHNGELYDSEKIDVNSVTSKKTKPDHMGIVRVGGGE